MKIWQRPRHVYEDSVELEQKPLLERKESIDDDSNLYKDDISKMRRKGKCLNMHDLVKGKLETKCLQLTKVFSKKVGFQNAK